MRLNISLVIVLGLLFQPFWVTAECTPASIVELFTNSSISEVKSFRDLPKAVQDSMLEDAPKQMPESMDDSVEEIVEVPRSRIADIGQPWNSLAPMESLRMAGHVDDIWFSVVLTGGCFGAYRLHFFCMGEEELVQKLTYYVVPRKVTQDWFKTALKEECIVPASGPDLSDEIRNRCWSYRDEYEKVATPTPAPSEWLMQLFGKGS